MVHCRQASSFIKLGDRLCTSLEIDHVCSLCSWNKLQGEKSDVMQGPCSGRDCTTHDQHDQLPKSNLVVLKPIIWLEWFLMNINIQGVPSQSQYSSNHFPQQIPCFHPHLGHQTRCNVTEGGRERPGMSSMRCNLWACSGEGWRKGIPYTRGPGINLNIYITLSSKYPHHHHYFAQSVSSTSGISSVHKHSTIFPDQCSCNNHTPMRYMKFWPMQFWIDNPLKTRCFEHSCRVDHLHDPVWRLARDDHDCQWHLAWNN